MAAWAGDLLFRMTEVSQDRSTLVKDAPGILLLDEMDLHLHPVWQRELVNFLKSTFPELQIIATTHSPLSVQSCAEHELFVVRREESQPVIVDFAGDPSRMRLSELFLSPLIGLDTLDSPKIAALRDQARSIERQAGSMSPQDLSELDQIKEKLEGTSTLDPRDTQAFSELHQMQKNLERVMPSTLIRESERLFGATPASSLAKDQDDSLAE